MKSLRVIAFFVAAFFIFQTVVPAALIAAPQAVSKSMNSREFSKLYPSLPTIPQGINTGIGRNTQFYIHHLPDPVNVFNGNLFLAYQDVNIPFRTFPLEISRAYNSRGTVKGAFGYGWTSSLDVILSQSRDGSVTIREWDGSSTVYIPDHHEKAGHGEQRFITSQPTVQYVLKHADGRFSRFLGNGRKEIYSPKGVILKKEDAHGNRITFHYDKQGRQLLSLSDTAGRSIKLSYTPHGLIKSFTDPLKRVFQYDYAPHDSLIAVKGFAGEVTRYQYDYARNLTEITQPDGTKIRNIYDEKRDLVIMQQGPGVKKTFYQYDFPTRQEPFQQTIVTDSHGNTTVYSYFLRGNSVTRLIITDPMNRRITSEYDNNGNLVRQADSKGNTTTYRYDNFSRIVSMTDPSGNTWELGYGDGQCSKPTTLRDPEGAVIQFSFDSSGKVFEVVDANGKSHRVQYNQKGDAVKVVLSTAASWDYEYDKYGNIIRVTNPEGGTFTSVRDTAGRITAVTDPMENRYSYRYDIKGRLVETVNPMDYAVAIAYDAMDRITTITDYEGRYRYEYDAEGNIIALTDPEANTIRFGYDLLGKINKITDAAGYEWRYTYDRASQLTELINPKNQKARLEYDQAGNMTAYVNQLQERTVFSYDKNNRPVKITDPLGMSVAFQYNGLGKLIGVVDPAGRMTGYAYDKKGNMVSARNAANQTVAYSYDPAGNVVEYNDAAGSLTKLQYDKNRRLVKRTDPLGSGTSYEYNKAGQIIKASELGGREIRYTYNKLGLLSGVIPKNGAPTTYTYNKKNQLLTASEGEASYRYTYNKAGYLTEVEDITANKKIRYTYDSRYNRIKSEVLPDEGIQTIYSYDSLSQLFSIKTSGNDEYRFEYDPAGRRSSLTYPTKVITTYRYDNAGRLSELNTINAKNELLHRESYSFRKGMFISAAKDKDNRVTEYKYDQLNRLSEMLHPVRGRESFVYDAAGNILTHSTPSEATSYTYNKAHQMVSAGDENYEYDRSGNLVQKKGKGGAIKYQYDARNRLTGALLPDGSKLSYRYDPDGRIIATDNKGEQNTLMYDGDYPLLKMDKNSRTLSRLVYGSGFYELLGEEKGGKKQFFIANNIGSIVAVTNESGEVVSRIDYTAFGKPLPSPGALPPATFTGMPYQPETGLLLFKYRAYDPAHARFLQQEPLGLMTAWQNTYGYASNNPANMIDVYGLLSFYQWVGAATVAVGVAAAAVILAPIVIPGGAIAAGATAISTAVGGAAAAVATSAGFMTASGVTTAGLVATGAAAGAAITNGTITAINTSGSTGDKLLAGIGAATVGAVAATTATAVGTAAAGSTFITAGVEVSLTPGQAAALGGFTNGMINATANAAENKSRGEPVNVTSSALGVAASTFVGGFGGAVFDGGNAATTVNGVVFGASADAAQAGTIAVIEGASPCK